jgi:ribonuclease Z
MELKFIGTSSGTASLKRHHSSILVMGDKYKLLIDTGDGISKALLYQNVVFNEINGILYSHFHPDHLTGLGSLIVQMKKNKRSEELVIFIHSELESRLEFFLENSYLYQNRFGFPLKIVTFHYEEEVVVSEQIKFVARYNTHLEKLKEEKKNFSISSSSFLFFFGKRLVHYTADIGREEDLNLFDDINKEIIISEVTHIPAEAAYKKYKETGAASLILTHINEDDEGILLNFMENLEEEEMDKVKVAIDGLSIEL